MNREEFQSIKALFPRVRNLPPSERKQFLGQACRGAPGLQCALEEMLAEDRALEDADEAGGLRPELERLWQDAETTTDQGDESPAPLPERIGPFRIIRKIGEGGMGTVFEAEQDHPLRTVALKLLRSVVADSEMMRRFRREIDLLGALEHPGIARIYEAGTVTIGGIQQPYFTMELVRGGAITEFVRQHQLETRRLLELFARLCDAVEHAHQHGIVHRDLKPSNILVDALLDGGQPKVLDFGVARAFDRQSRLAGDVQVTTMQTDAGQILGTLLYMSPEQAGGPVTEIDLRTDVYSLGIILYELLTGKPPYDIGGCSVPEALRIIREVEPKRLSAINAAYRGDLPTIVAAAIHKDAGRRYQAAAELGADLRRYLAREPIHARPLSRMYHLRKFTARHQGLVAGLAFALIALLGGTITSTSLFLSARADRDKARSALEESKEVTALLSDLLLSAAPETQADGLLVRNMLDQAAASLGGRFRDRPVVEASLCEAIGRAYQVLGELDTAAPFLQRSLEIRRTELGPRHEATATALRNLANLALFQGRQEEAERFVTEAIEIQTELFGSEQSPKLSSLDILSQVLSAQGRFSEALDVARRAHEARLQVNAPPSSETIRSVLTLAGSLFQADLLDDAEALYESIIAGDYSVSALDSARARCALGMIQSIRGRLEDADALFTENESILQRHVSNDHPFNLKNRTEIANLRVQQERYDEAEQILTDVLERSRRVLGEQHPHTLWTTYSLLQILVGKEDHEHALPIVECAVGETGRQAPGFLQLLADVHRGLGHTSVAAALEVEADGLPEGGHPWQRRHP